MEIHIITNHFMKRIERDYRDMCRAEGLELLRLEHRGRHYAMHFATGVVFAASTPSDWRHSMKVRAQLRRLHR